MLADLLFPEIKETIADLEKKYPKRPDGQIVTRIAPSPTGFVHIGTVFTTMVDDIFAHKSDNGVCILRIEDTDQKREVEGAKQKIPDILHQFGLILDEGPVGQDFQEIGDYGPYVQSEREYIYKVFIKEFVKRGLAYPCFMTEEELAQIREEQTVGKQVPGIYMHYSKRRGASFEDIKAELNANKPFVIRLKSPGKNGDKVVVEDMIKGKVEMGDSFLDIVIMKKGGLPTYHFAHLVDDYLMGTTHVIRSDEWFASLPLHLQLFKMLGIEAPKYVHISPLVKLDNGNKRKLSKRKDNEANVEFYFQKGYLIPAIIDYLANIINAGYESWRKENPKADFREYDFKIENMSKAGALVDMDKLNNVSKEFIATLTKDELYDYLADWSQKYDNNTFELISKNTDYTKQILNIEREQENPPKRFAKMDEIPSQILSFFDEYYDKMQINFSELLPSISTDDIQIFLKNYLEKFSLDKSKDEWFEDLKSIAHDCGFALNNQEFKSGNFIGKVGDAAMILRIVLCGQKQTPDLYESMQVLGRNRVEERIRKFL